MFTHLWAASPCTNICNYCHSSHVWAKIFLFTELCVVHMTTNSAAEFTRLWAAWLCSLIFEQHHSVHIIHEQCRHISHLSAAWLWSPSRGHTSFSGVTVHTTMNSITTSPPSEQLGCGHPTMCTHPSAACQCSHDHEQHHDVSMAQVTPWALAAWCVLQ